MSRAAVNDIFFLKEAIRLAKKGLSWTSPNPLVGAVIVKNGVMIGAGYHKKAGLPHAEIEALRNAKTSAKGATLYVNLEPCAHVGRTPPCVPAIIQAGITRVVCATRDPYEKVNGKGVAQLVRAGIDVSVGLLKEEAEQLNEAFFTFHTKKHPFIAIKFAASLDGKIATHTGDSRWITNEKARAFARTLRAHHDAILVGKNTVLRDNPHLGCRNPKFQDPLRIVLDSRLSLPIDSRVFRDARVLVVTTAAAREEKVREFEKRGIRVLRVAANTISIPTVLSELYTRNIQSILVEGGSQVIGSFFDAGLVDKVYAFHAPLIIGGKEAPGAVGGDGADTVKKAFPVTGVSYKHFGNTLLTVGYTERSIFRPAAVSRMAKKQISAVTT